MPGGVSTRRSVSASIAGSGEANRGSPAELVPRNCFSVGLADVANAQKIAEKGQRRFRAGDSYHSVREWLKRALAARRRAERISLHGSAWKGKAKFRCRLGAEDLFSVRLDDVAYAQKIAEEGQRRLLAGGRYAAVTAWLASEMSAARRTTAPP